MEWMEVLKLYGPQALPWMALAYLGKWHLDRTDLQLKAQLELALALHGLTEIIKSLRK